MSRNLMLYIMYPGCRSMSRHAWALQLYGWKYFLQKRSYMETNRTCRAYKLRRKKIIAWKIIRRSVGRILLVCQPHHYVSPMPFKFVFFRSCHLIRSPSLYFLNLPIFIKNTLRIVKAKRPVWNPAVMRGITRRKRYCGLSQTARSPLITRQRPGIRGYGGAACPLARV